MKKFLVLAIAVLSFSSLSAGQLTWTAPTMISDVGVDASNPVAGMDGAGNGVAIWIENGVVKANYLPAGGSWGMPATISGTGVSALSLVVDSSGNATALWLQSGVVSSATQSMGGAWSSVISLSGAGTAASPFLNLDTLGNTVAVWTQTNAGTETIQSSTKLVGGSWQASPDTISGVTTSPNHPAVSIGPNGLVVAVWHALGTGGSDVIYSASKTISGGGWGSPISFFQGLISGFRHDYPNVIVDGGGNANAIWYRFNQSGNSYSDVVVLTSQLPAGASAWTIPIVNSLTASERNPADFFQSRMLIDLNGTVLAIWGSSYDGKLINVETAAKPFNQAWVLGGPLTSTLYSYAADIAVDVQGNAVLLYMAYNGTNTNIISVEATIDSETPVTFTFPNLISTTPVNGYPWVASTLIGTTGNAVGVWVTNNGSNNIIAAATGTKTVVLPPSNVTVIQSVNNYLVFQEYFNTVSWQASLDPNLTEYNIFRNGLFIATVTAPVQTYIDPNVTPDVSVTYSVGAIDTSGEQSALIPGTLP